MNNDGIFDRFVDLEAKLLLASYFQSLLVRSLLLDLADGHRLTAQLKANALRSQFLATLQPEPDEDEVQKRLREATLRHAKKFFDELEVSVLS